MPKNRLRPLIYVGMAIPFIALPFVITGYYVNILTAILIWFIVAVSYRLLATTGEFSLSHVVIMGIGAYTTALVMRYFGYSFWLAAPIGGLASAGFAAATAYPLFRMKGFYFLLGSFAIGEGLRLCWMRWVVPFGGHIGLRNIPSPSLGAFTFDTVPSFYYLTLGITAACLAVTYLINRSRWGKNLVAIHWQDSLCESLGINVLGHKVLAYVVASFFAGIAGGLVGPYLHTFNPQQFSIANMLYLIVWVIVGGTNTFWGPILGILTLYPIQEVLRIYFTEYMPMFYGIVLITIVLALPGGLESIPARVREWRKARSGRGVKLKEIVSG